MDDVTVALDGRFLVATFARPHRVLSFAVARPGFVDATQVAWCQVRDDELAPPVEPHELLARELAAAGLANAVGMMTSAALDTYDDVTRTSGGASVRTVVTVGLDNARRAGDEWDVAAPPIGTINVFCRASLAVSDAALVEMLALAAEARAMAVLEAGVRSPKSGLPATGTGTDCIVVAAPCGEPVTSYAGKHTALGHLVGATVAEAVGRGARAWLRRHPARGLAWAAS